jgi:tetratricopeptide (TPR) repeat protein
MNAMNALMSQAEIYLTQQDIDRAVAIVCEAKKLEPQSLEPDVMMASIALHVGKLNESKTILDGVIQRLPMHARSRMLRGLVHEAHHEYSEALASFELATRFDPNSMPSWFNRGRLMLNRQRVPEAAMAFEKAAEIAPDNVAVLAAWAQALAKLGHARRAANVYLRCIEQNVANPFFLAELADLLVNAEEHPLAEEVLAAGSRTYETQGLFDSKLAALALQRSEPEVAARHAREAVRRQPDCVEFLLGLTNLEIMRLKLDEARTAAERVLKLEPTNWTAHHQLGIIFEACKLKEKAMSFYRRAIECAPKEWAPRNNLAVLLMETGIWSSRQEACALLEEAVQFGIPSATVLFNLALAQDGTGQRKQARETASRAATLVVRGRVTLPVQDLATALA